jgi:hypothetical protein
MSIKTEYDFSLPSGYLDSGGRLHRQGKKRLATRWTRSRAWAMRASRRTKLTCRWSCSAGSSPALASSSA